MAGITLEQAQSQLDLWLAAAAAVALNQEYEISTGDGSRRLKRADAATIQKSIEFWDARVKALSPAAVGGRRRTRYIVPE